MLDPGLLHAILAAPDDDLPRLIAADWLDEHGEAERAEFIRVQCQIALALEPGKPLGNFLATVAPHVGERSAEHLLQENEQYAALRRRERELLLKHWRAWAPRLSPIITYEIILSPRWRFSGTPAVEFRRGFVAELHCNAADLLAHAAAIFAAQPVEAVRLTDRVPPDTVRGRFSWLRGRQGRNTHPFIAVKIYNHLAPEVGRHHQSYQSVREALSALSAACVRFGRQLAHLPAWEPSSSCAPAIPRTLYATVTPT